MAKFAVGDRVKLADHYNPGGSGRIWRIISEIETDAFYAVALDNDKKITVMALESHMTALSSGNQGSIRVSMSLRRNSV